MSFKSLILREVLWWFRSYALWWSVFPLLILTTCFPYFILKNTGYKLSDFEQLWQQIAFAYQNFKPVIESNLMVKMTFSHLLESANTLFSMNIDEVWKKFYVPPLQFWSILPVSLILSPLAVTLFNRDRNNGFYQLLTFNKKSLIKLQVIKFLISSVFVFIVYGLSIFLYLLVLKESSGRPEFFNFSYSMWSYGVLLGGFSIGLLTIAVSWLCCLFSKNGATEIYTAILSGKVVMIYVLFFIKQNGWTESSMLMFTCVNSCVALLFVMITSLVMKKDLFLKV